LITLASPTDVDSSDMGLPSQFGDIHFVVTELD
jgi:hypothetical protein